MNTFNPLDDHYKKKFKDWSVQPRNDMWADIQKRMESENKEKPIPFWMSFNNKYTFTILGIALLISTILYFYYPKSVDSIVQFNEKSSISNSNGTKPITLNSKIIDKSYNSENQNITNYANENSDIKSFTSKTIFVKNDEYETRNYKQISRNIKTRNSQINNLKKNNIETLANNNASIIAQQILKNDNITEKNNEISSNNESRIAIDYTPISIVQNQHNLLNINDINLDVNKLPFTKKLKIKTDKRCYGDDSPDNKLNFELYMNGGFTMNKFASKIGDQTTYIQNREFSESSKMNFGYGGRLVYTYKRTLNIKAGFDYSQINTTFIHRSPGTRIITIIDTIQTDQGPKVISSTYSENGYNITKVADKYKFIDIPITVGYQKRFSNFLLQLNAGVSFNLAFSQQGKILNNLNSPVSIDRYDTKKADIYKSNAGMSLIASLQLQMPLSKKNYIFIEPNFKYVIKDLTKSSYSLSHKVSMLGSQIGIGFNL